METFPGKMKGQPAVFVHDCVAGCPGMGPKPLMPIAGKPLRKLGNIVKRSEAKTRDSKNLEDTKGHQSSISRLIICRLFCIKIEDFIIEFH